jgi:ABC-type transport system involved in multi-copper enzyme maturation permease subunit
MGVRSQETGMIVRTIAGKEILSHIKDGRFLVSSVAIVLLLVVSTVLSLETYKVRRDTIRTIDDTERVMGWNHGEHWVWNLVHQQMWNHGRPMQISQVLARGSERNAELNLHTAYRHLPTYEGDWFSNPLQLLFGSLDFLFVVGAVLSLIVFLVSHNFISSEKEAGTLRLLLAGPLPRDSLILGKLLGGLVSVLMPYAFGAALVSLIIALDAGVSATGADAARIALLILCGALYVAVVYALSVAVSVWANSSSTSILLLLVVWAVQVLALPSLAGPVARMAVQSPSWPDRQNAAAERTFVSLSNRISAMWREMGFGYRFFDQSQEKRDRFDRAQWDMFCEESNVVLRQIDRYTRDDRQRDLTALWINRLSFYGCLQNAGLALANTGADHEYDLAQYNREYYREMLQFVRNVTDTTFGAVNAGEMARYRFTPRSVGQSIGGALLDVTLLCVMGVLFFLLAYARFLRMSVA